MRGSGSAPGASGALRLSCYRAATPSRPSRAQLVEIVASYSGSRRHGHDRFVTQPPAGGARSESLRSRPTIGRRASAALRLVASRRVSFPCRAARVRTIGCRHRHARQGFLLQPQIGLEIYLRRLDGLVSRPKGDHRLIHPMLQQLHRGAVSEGVRADALAGEQGHDADTVRTCLRTRCSSATRLSFSPRIVGKSGRSSPPRRSRSLQ